MVYRPIWLYILALYLWLITFVSSRIRIKFCLFPLSVANMETFTEQIFIHLKEIQTLSTDYVP